MKRTYIITGIGGHVGNTVARILLDAGETVRGFSLPKEDLTMLYGDHISIVRGDVRIRATLEPLFYGLDPEDEVIVIHAAGIVSVESGYRKDVVDVNVMGTRNVIDLCRAHKVKKLVYVSSVHAIPEFPTGVITAEVGRFSPDSVEGLYAKTKAEATQLVLDAAREGLDATVVQPSGIIGPFDYGRGHMTQMIKSYLDGSLTACVEGGFDFVDVRDVASAIVAACDKGRSGQCYILSNRYFKIRELLSKLYTLTGLRKIQTVLPIWFAMIAAPFAEFFSKLRKEAPLITPYSLKTLMSSAKFSSAKARRELGFRPRDMQQTLKDTVEFLTRNRKCKVKRVRFRRTPLGA